MPHMFVHWKSPSFSIEEGKMSGRSAVHHGFLTTDHEAAEAETPVLVEEETERVYRPGDQPPDTVLYVDLPPGELPDVLQLARRSGYRVERT